jgi:phage terminase large subunit
MTSNELKLSEIIAPQFYEVHRHIRDEVFSELWLKGGRGSTKSTFASQQIIFSLIRDNQANGIAFRKTGNTIRDSILPTILSSIDRLEKSPKFDHIKSPTEITYLPTGQKILMRGLDDESKLRSIKAEKGYFKILWFEELQEFDGMNEIRSVRQSVSRGGEKFITIFTFNPPKDPNHWIYEELQKENPDRFVHHSSFLEVPRHWLGEEFFKIAERLKANNFEAYQHEYEGIPVGNPEQIVFAGKYEVREFNEVKPERIFQNRFFYGLDFGFSNDPAAFVRAFIQDDCLFVDYEAGGVSVEMQEMESHILSQIADSRKWRIFGDCSRPETIAYIKRLGYLIEPCKKWSGSVEDGIAYLKSFKKIIIHPRCTELIKEMGLYSYKVDRISGKPLPILLDKYNHYIDALRYSLDEYIKSEATDYSGLLNEYKQIYGS